MYTYYMRGLLFILVFDKKRDNDNTKILGRIQKLKIYISLLSFAFFVTPLNCHVFVLFRSTTETTKNIVDASFYLDVIS